MRRGDDRGETCGHDRYTGLETVPVLAQGVLFGRVVLHHAVSNAVMAMRTAAARARAGVQRGAHTHTVCELMKRNA